MKEEESLNHLFWKCDVAVWARDFVGSWWSITKFLSSIDHFSLRHLLSVIRSNHAAKIWRPVVAATLWTI